MHVTRSTCGPTCDGAGTAVVQPGASNARLPGKTDRRWPSGPIPTRTTSNSGRPARVGGDRRRASPPRRPPRSPRPCPRRRASRPPATGGRSGGGAASRARRPDRRSSRRPGPRSSPRGGVRRTGRRRTTGGARPTARARAASSETRPGRSLLASSRPSSRRRRGRGARPRGTHGRHDPLGGRERPPPPGPGARAPRVRPDPRRRCRSPRAPHRRAPDREPPGAPRRRPRHRSDSARGSAISPASRIAAVASGSRPPLSTASARRSASVRRERVVQPDRRRLAVAPGTDDDRLRARGDLHVQPRAASLGRDADARRGAARQVRGDGDERQVHVAARAPERRMTPAVRPGLQRSDGRPSEARPHPRRVIERPHDVRARRVGAGGRVLDRHAPDRAEERQQVRPVERGRDGVAPPRLAHEGEVGDGDPGGELCAASPRMPASPSPLPGASRPR